MIDDFEDGDDNVCQHDGRSGQWYVYTNGGTITPAGSPVNPQLLPAPEGSSTRAMHFVSAGGDPFSRPSIGFSLVGIGAAAQPFDASMYSGVRFQGSSNVLEDFDLVVQTTSTETVANGGACVSDCSPNECYSPLFGNGWNEYDFTWDQFTGGNASLNPAELRSITFQFRETVDIWIDDVEFF